MTAFSFGYTLGSAGAAVLVGFVMGVFTGSLIAEVMHGGDEGEG